MDCRTAHLLIEAFHDDELGVVEAATLLSHLETCPDCERRCEAARRLKSVFRDSRPVVACPEALKRRVARRVDHARRFPFAVPPSVTLFLLATGLGVLIGELVPLRGRPVVASGALPITEAGVTERVSGEVLCVRCALERLFPESSFRAAGHHPVLRTADGRLFTILPGPSESRLAAPGCAGTKVEITARVFPRSGLADVVSVRTGSRGTPMAVARGQ